MAEDEENKPKKRRIHMDCSETLAYSVSDEGSAPLTNPASVANSSKDPNRGLYPRPPREKQHKAEEMVDKSGANHAVFGFVSAKSVLEQSNKPKTKESPGPSGVKQWPNSQKRSSPQKVDTWGVKRTVKSTCFTQMNKLNSYFKATPAASTVTSTKSEASSSKSKVDDQILDVIPQHRQCDIESIDLTQDSRDGLTVPVPKTFQKKKISTSSTNAFTALKPTKSRGKKSKKAPPTFNRSNPFLYSGLPSQVKRKSSDGENSDPYGLLGTGGKVSAADEDEDNEGESLFLGVPLEVIENIFCRVPLMDLCLNLTMVCKEWNEIISEETFLTWKKTYFRILRGDPQQRQQLKQTMAENGMNLCKPETILPALISYMRSYKRVSSRNMTECLRGHPRYTWAKALITERLPDLLQDGEPHPWSCVAALVVVSETVACIQAILACLVSPRSQCTAVEVLECLYCVAACLLVLKDNSYMDVWTGLHYRVYYALYLFENESVATYGQLQSAFSHTAGQQTILKYGQSEGSVQYTNEQLRICNHNVGAGEILKIVAFAGTGKTTTLIRYTQLRPQLRFLLLVYNKSVKEHCESRFPKNVVCKTSHGLAMSSKVARRFGHKIGNFRVSDFANALTPRKGENLYVQAKFVIDTLNNFMASADRSIELSHVPMESTNDKGEKIFIGTETRELLREDARMMWERATDARDTDFRLPHDGYLKVYQLSEPALEGYNVVLVDEAQDLTPAVIDIVLRQRQPKILVGDPNQQIYSFRGAVSAMATVHATSTYYLTQSFRFGSEIAFVANCCLELFKGEKKKVLVGNKTRGATDGTEQGQVAIITRSNFTLFSEAVRVCCHGNHKPKVAFAGGIKNFGFEVLQDIYALLLPEEERIKDGHVITHPLIKRFRSLPDLERFASKTHDNEMLGKIKIVRTYQHQLPGLVRKITACSVKDQGLAELVLSTAHKAKGLEFSTVRVTDDFVGQFVPIGRTLGRSSNTNVGSSPDEYNLLYVAVTRAKKALRMSPTLMRVLDYSGERFRYPRLTSDLSSHGDGDKLSCLLTEEGFTPTALTLQRRQMTLTDGQEVVAGVYSPQVVREDLPSQSGLWGSISDLRAPDQRHHLLRTQRETQWDPPWIAIQLSMADMEVEMAQEFLDNM